jgi:hypothetical protein
MNTVEYASHRKPVGKYEEKRDELELVDLGEKVIEQFVDGCNITYLPNREWVEASIKHYCNPRSIVLHEDDFHYLVEYVIEYFAD